MFLIVSSVGLLQGPWAVAAATGFALFFIGLYQGVTEAIDGLRDAINGLRDDLRNAAETRR